MAVRWLPEALADVERLYHFLVDIEPAAARKALDCIQFAAQRLEEHPAVGRLMPDESGRREWVAPFGAGAYVIRYRLLGGDAVILRVWHSKEWRS